MLTNIEEYLNRLIIQPSTDKEECEVLQYGLHQSLTIIVNLVSTLGCGILWGKTVFSLLLFANLFFLRPYVGGYHADTERRCYIISVGIMNLAIIGMKFISVPIYLMTFIYVSMFIIIWKNAPITNPINPLETMEIQKYSKKTKQIITVYTLIMGVGMYLEVEIIYSAVWYTMIIATLSVFAGAYKYKIHLKV